MFEYFFSLEPLMQAIVASLLTLSMTILGSATVFLFKKINKNIMNSCLAISAGIMLSAAIFSLLIPSIEQAKSLHMNTPLVVTASIIGGAILLIVGDKFSSEFVVKDTNKIKRTLMLITSIVLHNIPEGCAIGVAFASVVYHLDGATVMSSISLAIGIGIQNFPEGAAVSIPLRREGMSRLKSFVIGALSGIVEPIAAIVGFLVVLKVKLVLPYLLAFAAGAMIFVVVEELVPEALSSKYKKLMGFLTLAGFTFMMLLEICL